MEFPSKHDNSDKCSSLAIDIAIDIAAYDGGPEPCKHVDQNCHTTAILATMAAPRSYKFRVLLQGVSNENDESSAVSH